MISAASAVVTRKARAGAARLLPLLFVLGVAAGCGGGDSDAGDVVRLSGATMGTTWHVTVVTQGDAQPKALASGVQGVLDGIHHDMSTYLPDSDLSRFNRAGVDEAVPVSARTLAVTLAALDVARETDYAFNPAVGALVELWGFGAAEARPALPDDSAIEAAMATARLDRLQVDAAASALRKSAPLSLDLSAIAKGYGVDQVAQWLEQQGLGDYLVEVGGELKTAGRNPDGRLWRVGIEKPQLVPGQAELAIALSGQAIATSGDYRNYREVDGQRFSHEIDPRTGRPISHNLASASVIADSAMLADGYATALMVMGPDAALRFANQRALPVYLLVKTKEGVRARYSEAFRPYLQ